MVFSEPAGGGNLFEYRNFLGEVATVLRDVLLRHRPVCADRHRPEFFVTTMDEMTATVPDGVRSAKRRMW